MYCPECGFHQSDANNFCARCGARLAATDATGEITGSYAVKDIQAETGEWQGPGIDGPTLAVRAGGPPGQMFALVADPVTIGRSPDSEVFLDDVTVSRNHALIMRAEGALVLRDLGSLNGTYVNRRRIEGDERLEDGDELQIGKFRLTYLAG
jgi:pSer/pThr/pTyr-binding forkhead associated (FHA) protein